MGVVDDEPMLRLRVLLHSWTGVEACAAAEFAACVKAADPRAPGPPGYKFLLPRADDTPLVSYYDERENPGWERTVDEVLAMSFASESDPYRDSVFFRPLGVRAGGEPHEARRVPLAPGERASVALRFYNLHLTEQDAYGKRLRLSAPAESLRLSDAPSGFPLHGDLNLDVEVVGRDPELTVQIGPAPARHTAVLLRLGSRSDGAAPRARRGSAGRGGDTRVRGGAAAAGGRRLAQRRTRARRRAGRARRLRGTAPRRATAAGAARAGARRARAACGCAGAVAGAGARGAGRGCALPALPSRRGIGS